VTGLKNKATVSEQNTKEAYQTPEREREEEMRRTLIRQKLECEMAVQQWKDVGEERLKKTDETWSCKLQLRTAELEAEKWKRRALEEELRNVKGELIQGEQRTVSLGLWA